MLCDLQIFSGSVSHLSNLAHNLSLFSIVFDINCSCAQRSIHINGPFAQLLPGLETGHPVTIGQSPAYDFSVSDEQNAVLLVSVSDCSECDSYAGD